LNIQLQGQHVYQFNFEKKNFSIPLLNKHLLFEKITNQFCAEYCRIPVENWSRQNCPPPIPHHAHRQTNRYSGSVVYDFGDYFPTLTLMMTIHQWIFANSRSMKHQLGFGWKGFCTWAAKIGFSIIKRL